MSEELKPCPFCRGKATAGGSIRQHYGEIYRVGCDKKGCAGWRYESVMYKSREAAIEAWNTRTPEQAIAATQGSEREAKLERLVRSLYTDYHDEWPDRADEVYAERMKELGIEVDAQRDNNGTCPKLLSDEADSREKLEADVWAGCEHLTTAERKDVLVNVPWAKLLGWLDRAADIRECEFIQQYCAECETAENAALKSDIEVLRNRLDNLAAERDEKAGLLETAFRRCKELEAENDALMAAHADDVERLDLMGEGELQRQVDELQAEVNEYQHAMNRVAGKWAKADAECAELQVQIDELQNMIIDICRKHPYTFNPEAPQDNLVTIGKYIDELQAQVNKLNRECDYWKLHTDLWADKYKEVEYEREIYRKKLAHAIDNAHDTYMLMDEGMA